MTTYFTIISAVLRPEIQEKISVGLFISNGEDFYFEYSKNKLSALKPLLSSEAFQNLKDGMVNIENFSKKVKNREFSLFAEKTFLHQTKYIEYLSRYNNNLISFSKPKEIEVAFNSDNFKKLFNQYIDNQPITTMQTLPEGSKIEVFKKTRYEVLHKYFNIDQEITSNEVSDLIVPVSVTLIGQNEVPTFIQSIDMNKRVDFIRNDIAEILFLQKAFSYAHKDCIAMTLTEEPDKKVYPIQHDVWSQLRKAVDIRHIDASEAETIIDYAREHHVKPLFLENVNG